MKKLRLYTTAFVLGLTMVGATTASAHTVQHGESLWKISQKYGVSIQALKAKNGLTSNLIIPGQQLKVEGQNTKKVANGETHLLASLVESEAGGESYAGKLAVAAVVMNRVEAKSFPSTIKGVIYDKGQFQPVMEGTLKAPSNDAVKAAKEAIEGKDNTGGCLFFYNKKTAQNRWLDHKPAQKVIGRHTFSK
ncbi:cell wall hydrolase SleB [Fictibacillus macauensis ZFHKF-1]|uniref:Cell wall hydrolase SleB n=1 Tax=Fictibacillus macauensis ZFHKF-1 TaxID=1196324 RepID=I8UIS4_9BACL|nr:cell wall hydrolase [Fictibacillus macauensis]EIT86795.1 cell wall hydrolase SleB [Fictibacillus macauensis ZFHKF-1]